jgi:hypothetical protein
MKKPKFGIMGPIALFMEIIPVQTEHEKECVDVSHQGRTEMHYVARKSQWM